MKQGMFVLLGLLNCQMVNASPGQSNPYALKQQRIGDSQIILRLINRATGRTVWKKQAEGVDCIGWSADHKGLALSIANTGNASFRLLIWQEGKPIRLVDDSPMPAKYGGGFIDGVIDIAWSPDDRRMLFRVYQSGGKILNEGLLFCLDTKGWHLSSVPDVVRQMRWLGSNRARYQVIRYMEQGNGARAMKQLSFRFWNFE